MGKPELTLDKIEDVRQEMLEMTGDDPREVVIDDDPCLPSGCGWIYKDRLILTPDVWRALKQLATEDAVSGPGTLLGIPVVEERGAAMEAFRDDMLARFDPVPDSYHA